MDQDAARRRHRLRTHLTTVKLALQMLKRRPELCERDDGPRERALVATDELVEDVAQLERAMERAEASRPNGRPLPRTS